MSGWPFSAAFARLVGAFDRYWAAPREPERVVELAGARADLDDARREVRDARVADGAGERIGDATPRDGGRRRSSRSPPWC